MSVLPDRFVEDRRLRDQARAVLAEDIARLKDNLGEEGLATRVSSGVTATITGRIRSGARDVLEQARAQAGDSKGVLALLVGAILLFLARGPITAWIAQWGADDAPVAGDEASDPALPDVASSGDPE